MWYSIGMTSKERKDLEFLIEQKIEEYLGDPDVGRQLRPEFVAELKRRMKKKQKTISHTEVLKRYDLV
jgi:ethanolamine ammonia-lyase small subunit